MIGRKFPNMKPACYSVIRPFLMNGDLLLCKGKGLISREIRRCTKSDWSHVGVIVWLQDFKRVAVMESRETKGVHIRPLSQYIRNFDGKGKGYNGDLLIARHIYMAEANIKGGFRAGWKYLTYNYDIPEIIRIWLRLNLGLKRSKDNNLFICSEYAELWVKGAGIIVQRIDKSFVVPVDFALDSKIDAKWALRTEQNAD